ncbi:hypothetical protein P5673_018212 [Acropora cervicornis]|uniref:Uncharacterized protein n=1 Tax=Acropora cervicornis TaxID=6130 RepID=A0AAD9QDA9_ACRCE|nr:hypothetical protein P5673_018212 [Acropora cervicornis]
MQVITKCYLRPGSVFESSLAFLPSDVLCRDVMIRASSDSHLLIYPFATVGIDYCGPLYVQTGPVTRSANKNPRLQKRCGCIFTYLRYQAVHIGIASNLSRDSFIYAMMRFVGGRVHPEQFTEIMVQILGERRLM